MMKLLFFTGPFVSGFLINRREADTGKVDPRSEETSGKKGHLERGEFRA